MAGTHISRRSMLGSVGAASLTPVLLKASENSFSPTPSLTDAAALPHASPVFVAQLRVTVLATDAAIKQVAITGGELQGPSLEGVVQGGRIEWQPQATGLAVVVRFAVRRADGTLVELCERGLQADCADVTAAARLSTVSQPAPEDDSALPALRVGRLDLTGLQQGMVRLLAFEVS